MRPMEAELKPENWQTLLETRRYGRGPIFWKKETGSTNADAMTAGKEGAPDGSVFLAETQTAGRGRRDHLWISEAGGGIWLSVLVRPDIPAASAAFLPFCCALAVRDAVLKLTGISLELKWPNDVLYRGKKCCGVLCICRTKTENLDFAVLGTGINVLPSAVPPSLRDQAVSVNEFAPEISRNALLAKYLSALEKRVETLEREGFAPLREAFAEHCGTLGASVRVSGGTDLTGTAVGLDTSGALLIRTEDGKLIPVLAGDVSVRKTEKELEPSLTNGKEAGR